MKSRTEELDEIVSRHDLNKHPFYTDWRSGCLPTEKLADYAAEYRHFIGTIADGWETLGENRYADEERIHEGLWADFAFAVSAENRPTKPQTNALRAAASEAFRTKAEACGALYAFEVQQPNTAQTKLEGLNAHYDVCERGKEYFRVHANDFQEVEDLKTHIGELSDQEFAKAKTSCAVLCAAMWSALDGIYDS